jgi:16S rRNA (guanine527-N7)-methyltransferase
MDVSRETEEMFAPYCALLRKWTGTINLVAPSTVDAIFDRHVLDCLQILPLIPTEATSAVDLGSGAGLPGLVVAAALQRQGRPIQMTLIESDRRKCAFLAEAARALDVRVDIQAMRILDLPARHADVVMARALAPLTELLAYQQRHGAPGSCGIYMKGARHADEIAQARRDGWMIDVVAHPAATADSAILLVTLGTGEA